MDRRRMKLSEILDRLRDLGIDPNTVRIIPRDDEIIITDLDNIKIMEFLVE